MIRYKIVLLLFTILHIVLFVLNLIPRYLYASIGAMNYFSMILGGVDFVLLIVLFFIKNKKIVKYLIRINILFIIPALVWSFFLEKEPSKTTDCSYYLKLDREEIEQEARAYFPSQILEEQVQDYYYIYFNEWGQAVEVSLLLSVNENEYLRILDDFQEKYPKIKKNSFSLNESYQEFVLKDSEVSLEKESFKSLNIKKVIFCEEKGLILFEYLVVSGDVLWAKDIFYLNFIKQIA